MSRTKGRDRAREDGFTLIELLVAMGVFSVVLAISITGIVSISQNLRKSANISDESDQLRKAFLALDKSVRYADAIGTPGKVGTTWYVEFESSANNVDTCFQWRVVSSSGRLQKRTWLAKNGYTSASAWATVATGIVNDPANAAQQPFALVAAPTGGRQKLNVDFLGKRGGSSAGTAETKLALVARNSGPSSAATPCDPANSRS